MPERLRVSCARKAPSSWIFGVGPFCPDEGVGVVAVRQEQEPELLPALQRRQRVLERAPGRGAACPIAVEAEHHLVAQARETFEGLGRRRGAERRADEAYAVLRERNHVHVAFDDQHARDVAQRLA